MSMNCSVKNGFSGTDVWVTIYNSTAFGRQIMTSGNVSSGQTFTFTWPNQTSYAFYVRCETYIKVQGESKKYSDTTAELDSAVKDLRTRILVTLLPQSIPFETWVEPGLQDERAMPLGLSSVRWYIIQSGVSQTDGINTSTGFLSVDPNDSNSTVIESVKAVILPVVGIVGNRPPDTMIWVKQDTTSNCIVLTNLATGTLLCSTGMNGGKRPQLIQNTPLNQLFSLWTIGGDFPTRVAVRPREDDSQNLNVFGNGPYNDGNMVGTSGWGGGAPNEVWTFVPV